MIGLDLLGLGSKHWPLKDVLTSFPQGFALGVFDTTFGDVLPKVRLLLDTGKIPAVRVHISWDKDHATKETIASLDLLKKRCPPWEKLAKSYPSVVFYVSHSCEYSEKNKEEIAKRVSLVQTLCPSCIAIQTPMNSPVIQGVGAPVEWHGSKAQAKIGQIVSTDGNEIQQMNAEAWVKKNAAAAIIFLWGARFNLREVSTPEHPTPPEIERTAYPSGQYIKGIARLGLAKGGPPVPAFKALALKKPELWKSFAEDYPGEGDKRANKPVVMLPKKTPYIDLVTSQGAFIARLLLYQDTNKPKLQRYYSGGPGGPNLYAYQIGEKALSLSGYEWVWIKQGEEYFGPIQPAFRSPFF